MSAEMQNDIREPQSKARRGRIITGLALIALGALALAGQFFNTPSMGSLILPGLALVFLLWGIIAREGGLMIPGGILAGIATGVYLMDAISLEGSAEPGVFMLAFGGGFALITLLSAVFTDETHWWALWPGGILALIGAALVVGGLALDVLSFVGRFWPVVLILIGLGILFRRR